MLSPKGKKEWEQIEEALYREELTIQGYNKYRRALFQKENLISPDRTEKEKHKDEKKDMDAVEGALSSHEEGSNADKISTFHSKEACFKVRLANICRHITRQLYTMTFSHRKSAYDSFICKIFFFSNVVVFDQNETELLLQDNITKLLHKHLRLQ